MSSTRWIAAIAALSAGLASAASASAQQTTYYRTEHTEVRTVELDEGDWARFRFGVSGHGAGAVGDGPDIGAGGVSLRVGIQLADLFAVYYMPVGLIGSFRSRPSGDTIAGVMFHNAMVDFTFADTFWFGIGPSADFFWGCDSRFQDEVDCEASDVFFGGDARLALNLFGWGQRGSRHALSLSFDVHPTVFDWDDGNVGVTLLGGLGYEMM